MSLGGCGFSPTAVPLAKRAGYVAEFARIPTSCASGRPAKAAIAQQPKCQSTGLLVLTRGFVAWWLRLLADSCSAREASGLRSGIRKNSAAVNAQTCGRTHRLSGTCAVERRVSPPTASPCMARELPLTPALSPSKLGAREKGLLAGLRRFAQGWLGRLLPLAPPKQLSASPRERRVCWATPFRRRLFRSRSERAT